MTSLKCAVGKHNKDEKCLEARWCLVEGSAKYYAKQRFNKLNHVFSPVHVARRAIDFKRRAPHSIPKERFFFSFNARGIWMTRKIKTQSESCAGCAKKIIAQRNVAWWSPCRNEFCAIWNITQGHEKRAIYFSLSHSLDWHKHEKRFVDSNRTSISKSCLWSKITTFFQLESRALQRSSDSSRNGYKLVRSLGPRNGS